MAEDVDAVAEHLLYKTPREGAVHEVQQTIDTIREGAKKLALREARDRIDEELDGTSGFPGYEAGLERANEILEEIGEDG